MRIEKKGVVVTNVVNANLANISTTVFIIIAMLLNDIVFYYSNMKLFKYEHCTRLFLWQISQTFEY